MKTASLVLGIVGGALAIIFAIFYLLGGAIVNTGANYVKDIDDLGGAMDDLANQLEDQGWTVDDSNVDWESDVDWSSLDSAVDVGIGAVTAWLYVAGILSIVGGVLGIIGGAIVKKKNIVSGVLLIIAAVLSCFTVIGIISGVVLALAAVFAFIKDKSAPVAA